MTKKIKKLSLNKKIVSNLNLQTQNKIIGGDDTYQDTCVSIAEMTCRYNECPTDETYCGPCDGDSRNSCQFTCIGWT